METDNLNQDCFSRWLLNEALRQFSNLSSRKASMNMLANFIEHGFNQRELELKQIAAANAVGRLKCIKEEEKLEGTIINDDENESKKRKRESDLDEDDDAHIQVPPIKKINME